MERSGTTVDEQRTTDFRCVRCGFPIKTLYIQYSPGNIRLMKCGNCKSVADGYIECEIMILILDLILHKPEAYRHVFYNLFGKESVNFESLLMKSFLAYLILDVYKMWVFCINEGEGSLPTGAKSLLMVFGKLLTGVIFGNLVFLCVVFHATRKFLNASAGFYGWKQILFAVLVSSYFKIFLLAMMVWEFPSSVIVIIDIFVISSNLVALKGAKYGYKWNPCLINYWFPVNVDHQLSDDEMLGCLCCCTWPEVFSHSFKAKPQECINVSTVTMLAVNCRCPPSGVEDTC